MAATLNLTLMNEMYDRLPQEQLDQAELRIRNAGKVWMGDFKIAIACLFALASLAFFGRIAIRLASRRRLYLDDCFLVVGFACLVGATAVFYERAREIYLVFGLSRGDEVITLIGAHEIDNVYNQLNWSFGYVTCLWTAVFAVKICYLAFFRVLINSMPRTLIRYYWFTVGCTLVAWIFLVLQQLISCPYFGESSSKCFPELPISNSVVIFTFCTGPILDALTDVFLVSIPIVVLRKSQMALLTKIGLGVFLCLSFVMMACSIIRGAGTWFHGTMDSPWQVFWLHAEACIAIFMASITVYRSILGGPHSISEKVQEYLEKILRTRTTSEKGGRSSSDYSGGPEPEPLTRKERFGQFLLSSIPTATLHGVITMFAETNHQASQSSYSNSNNVPSTIHDDDSATELGDVDYHAQLRNMKTSSENSSIQVGNRTICYGAAGDRRRPSSGDDTTLDGASSDGDRKNQQQQRRPLPPPSSSPPPGRVGAFFLRILFPHSHRAILQHRSIDNGQPKSAAGL